MLREPKETIISHYKMSQRELKTSKKYNISKEDSISDLILRPPIRGAQNYLCSWLCLDTDVVSLLRSLDLKDVKDFVLEDQFNFLKNISDEKLLETAKQHLLECKFFGLVERMEESLFLLHYTFGWKPVRDLVKLNVDPSADLSKDLTDDAFKILKKRTNVDTQLYEFAQQIFDRRYIQMVEKLKEKYYDSSLKNMDPNDLVYELLKKYYNDHFEESRPKVQSINYTFNQQFDGDGWFSREMDPTSKKMFRWSGPGKTSSIDLPLSREKDLKIQFHIIDYMASYILKSLNLKVNNKKIDLKFSHEKPQTRLVLFEGIIPKTALIWDKKFTRLTFSVIKTIIPSKVNPNSTEERSLGFAMDWLKIFPTAEIVKPKTSVFNNNFQNLANRFSSFFMAKKDDIFIKS